MLEIVIFLICVVIKIGVRADFDVCQSYKFKKFLFADEKCSQSAPYCCGICEERYCCRQPYLMLDQSKCTNTWNKDASFDQDDDEDEFFEENTWLIATICCLFAIAIFAIIFGIYRWKCSNKDKLYIQSENRNCRSQADVYMIQAVPSAPEPIENIHRNNSNLLDSKDQPPPSYDSLMKKEKG